MSPFTAGCVPSCSTPAPTPPPPAPEGNVSEEQQPWKGKIGTMGRPRPPQSPPFICRRRLVPRSDVPVSFLHPVPFPQQNWDRCRGSLLGFRNGHWSVPRLWFRSWSRTRPGALGGPGGAALPDGLQSPALPPRRRLLSSLLARGTWLSAPGRPTALFWNWCISCGLAELRCMCIYLNESVFK